MNAIEMRQYFILKSDYQNQDLAPVQTFHWTRNLDKSPKNNNFAFPQV